MIEAISYAVEGGLRLPIVYNTSSYDSLSSLKLLDGLVSGSTLCCFQYLTFITDRHLHARLQVLAARDRSTTVQGAGHLLDLMMTWCLQARDYPEVARGVILEMHR